jgi:hypothetical protein
LFCKTFWLELVVTDKGRYHSQDEAHPMTAPVLPESLLTPLPSVEDAYRMGRDYAFNGPNETNCHFRLFNTPEHTRAWEKGKTDAAAGK